MRKQFVMIAISLFFVTSFSSCFHRHHSTSVTLLDHGDEYELDASFDRYKTSKVQRLLDQELGGHCDASFKHERVNARITLEDQTTFYIRSIPGKLNIRFDKTENPEASCDRMKALCEDIRDLLAGNRIDIDN